MRSLERAGDRATRAAFDAEIAALWGDPAGRRRIRWRIAADRPPVRRDLIGRRLQ